ncbi:unnamed protein product [Trichobilharzia regenti]|nr:unnamed protein product [Trichobilharzia regenti]
MTRCGDGQEKKEEELSSVYTARNKERIEEERSDRTDERHFDDVPSTRPETPPTITPSPPLTESRTELPFNGHQCFDKIRNLEWDEVNTAYITNALSEYKEVIFHIPDSGVDNDALKLDTQSNTVISIHNN